MPGKPTIFEDPDFQALSPDGQLTALRDTDPDFAALSDLSQRKFLSERSGKPVIPAGTDFDRSMAAMATPEGWQAAGRAGLAGLKEGAASSMHTAANLADLWTKIPGAENIPGLAAGIEAGRGVEKSLIDSAAPDRGRDVVGKAAEVAGGLIPSLVPAGLAAKALGVIPGFAALEAVNAEDRGLSEAAKAAAKGAALGGVLRYTGTLPAAVRGAAVGGTAYALSNEPDTTRRLMDAGAMGILALPGHERLSPQAVRGELELRAAEALPSAARAPQEVPSEPARAVPAPPPARPETRTQADFNAINAADTAPPLVTPAPVLPGPAEAVQSPAQGIQGPPPATVQPPPTSPERVAPPWVPLPERIFKPAPVVPETRPITPEEKLALDTGTPIAEPQPKPGGNEFIETPKPAAPSGLTPAEQAARATAKSKPTPYTGTGYRGTGRDEKDSIYAEGANGPALGAGDYFAPSEKLAKTYGPNVERVKVRIENPYRIYADKDLKDLVPGYDMPFDNEGRSAYLAQARAELERRGHDGVVVDIRANADMDAKGRSHKRVREIFDHSQAIKFGGAEKPPVAEPQPKPGGNALVESRQTAPDADKLARAKEEARQAKIAVDRLGPEPPKPSSEKARFGTSGRKGAKPEDVAAYDAEKAAHANWKRAYSKLYDEWVNKGNDAFALEQEELRSMPMTQTPPRPDVRSKGVKPYSSEQERLAEYTRQLALAKPGSQRAASLQSIIADVQDRIANPEKYKPQKPLKPLSDAEHQALMDKLALEGRLGPDMKAEAETRLGKPETPPAKPKKVTATAERKAIEASLKVLQTGEHGLKLPTYPVLEILKKRGGVDPTSPLAGELRALGIEKSGAGSMPGLFRKRGLTAIDDLDIANEPVLVGNIPPREPGSNRVDTQKLLDAIERELRGNPVRSQDQHNAIESVRQPAEELGRFLESIGVDPKKATADQVLAEMQRTAHREVPERAPEPAVPDTSASDWEPLGDAERLLMRGVKPASTANPPNPGANYLAQRDVANLPPNTPLPRSIVKSGDVLEKLARALGQTVQQGSLRPFRGGPDALGVYEPGKNVLKIAKWGDLQVASHELFHRLAEDHYDLRGFYSQRAAQQSAAAAGRPFDSAEFRAIRDEMKSISYDKTNPEEGLSEFGRMWLTQKDTLPTVAPRALAKFEQWLAAQPKKTQAAMVEAQAEMHRYFEQGGEAAMESVFGPNNEAGAALSSAKDRWIQRNADDLHGLYVAERAIDPEHAGSAGGTYARFRMLRSLPSLVEKMWTSGVPKWDGAPGGKIKIEGKGLREILAPVATSGRALRQFEKYAVARMGQELAGQGREKLLTPEMIRQGLALETPERRAAFDELVTFNSGVADFAQESGLFNQTQRANWNRDQYAWGLFREMGERAAGRSVGDPLQASSGVYGLRGSSRNLKDPMSSIMAGPGRLVQLSLENLAKRDLARLLERPKGGLMGRRLPPDAELVRTSMQAVEDAVTKAAKASGVTLPRGHLSNQGYADFLSIFAGQKKPFGENVMTHLEDGKPVYHELYDPLLANAVAMMRRPVQGTMQNLLFNAPRRFYQRAVTSFPTFWVAQLARDPIMASMTTKTGMQAITSSIAGYMESLRNTELRQELEANLGGIGGMRPSSTEARRSDLLQYAHRKAGSPAVALDIMNPMNWFRAMERIGVAIEEGPRLGEFKRAKRQGDTTQEAAYKAREVTTDFSMQGASDLNQWMTSSIPFFRAMVASSYRSYRANVTDPSWRGATRARFATMAGLSAAYYLYAHDKDWYTSRPAWERMTKWIFPPMNLGTDAEPNIVQPTIPKAYETGFLGNLAEIHAKRLLDWKNGKDLSLRQYGSDVIDAIMLNFGVGLPVVLSSGLEQYSNKASFTDAPIETMGMSNLYPSERRGPNTPLVLEDLAQLQRGLPYNWKDLEVSAPRMQAALRSFLGPYAQYGLMAADGLVYGDGKPDLHDLTDVPPMNRVFTRPGQYSDTPTDFYNFIEQATMATNTYKKLVERRDSVAAHDLLKSDPMVQFGPEATRWQDAVNAMDKQIDFIRRGHLSGAEKQKRIDRIQETKQDFMSQRLSEAKRRIDAHNKAVSR